MLTVRGKALEAGAVGDVVRRAQHPIEPSVQATVIGPGRVSIGRAGPLIANPRLPHFDDFLASSHSVSVPTMLSRLVLVLSVTVAAKRSWAARRSTA